MSRADRLMQDIALLLKAESAVVVVKDDDGQWIVGRSHIGMEDAARVLYASADAVVEQIPLMPRVKH